MKDFQKNIKQGIPDKLPTPKVYDENISHAPSRKDILSLSEKKQAVINALRYFPEKFHDELAPSYN